MKFNWKKNWIQNVEQICSEIREIIAVKIMWKIISRVDPYLAAWGKSDRKLRCKKNFCFLASDRNFIQIKFFSKNFNEIKFFSKNFVEIKFVLIKFYFNKISKYCGFSFHLIEKPKIFEKRIFSDFKNFSWNETK